MDRFPHPAVTQDIGRTTGEGCRAHSKLLRDSCPAPATWGFMPTLTYWGTANFFCPNESAALALDSRRTGPIIVKHVPDEALNVQGLLDTRSCGALSRGLILTEPGVLAGQDEFGLPAARMFLSRRARAANPWKLFRKPCHVEQASYPRSSGYHLHEYVDGRYDACRWSNRKGLTDARWLPGFWDVQM